LFGHMEEMFTVGLDWLGAAAFSGRWRKATESKLGKDKAADLAGENAGARARRRRMTKRERRGSALEAMAWGSCRWRVFTLPWAAEAAHGQPRRRGMLGVAMRWWSRPWVDGFSRK